MARLYLHDHEKGGNDAEKIRELMAKFNWRAANSQCGMPPPKAAAQRGTQKNAARGITRPGLRIYEGRAERELVSQVKDMTQAGIRMIGLGAHGCDARPEYNKATAAKCRKVGMDILSCTPEKLAEAMAHIICG